MIALIFLTDFFCFPFLARQDISVPFSWAETIDFYSGSFENMVAYTISSFVGGADNIQLLD